MGSNTSKPSDNMASYEWKGTSPSGASHDLVESLQASGETDSSRAKLMDLHIASRVTAELRKLEETEAALARAARERLSTAPQDKASDNDAQHSRHTVSKEVETLRSRLEGRKQVRDIPEPVGKARSKLVQCLRENDRRPLDCWEEVQDFKREVKKMEKGWVEQALS